MGNLVEWHTAAERCQLEELRLGCVAELAHRLAAPRRSLASRLAEAALLARRLDKDALAVVLGAVAAGTTASKVPSAQQLGEALPQAANPCTFE